MFEFTRLYPISVENNFYFEIHFVNFNLAPDCVYKKIDYNNGMKRTIMK